MSAPNDGGSAFPLDVRPGVIGAGCGPHVEWGMSLRDYFAGQALVGLSKHAGVIADRILAGGDWRSAAKITSDAAYLLADAMLAARAAPPPSCATRGKGET